MSVEWSPEYLSKINRVQSKKLKLNITHLLVFLQKNLSQINKKHLILKNLEKPENVHAETKQDQITFS